MGGGVACGVFTEGFPVQDPGNHQYPLGGADVTGGCGVKTFYLVSLGCPKNLVDAEVMIGTLERACWMLVELPEKADMLVVNTCGFVQSAVEEGIDEILALAETKKKFPPKKLVVAGCMVQRYREKLERELPEVDLFVGTEGCEDIGRIVNGDPRGPE